MRLVGTYFELTGRLAVKGRSAEAGTTDGGAAAGKGLCALATRIPKRVVRSAVKRNTVKRIVRESLRAAQRQSKQGGCGAPRPVSVPRLNWMLRLRTHPAHPSQAAQAAPKPGFVRCKTLLRADADRLFAEALYRITRSAGRSGAPDGH